MWECLALAPNSHIPARCFIGKRRLETAMSQFADKAEFQVVWRPFLLNPNAPKEGTNKLELYKSKFGEQRIKSMLPMMTQVFAQYGLRYSLGGLTGSTLNSHRLISLAKAQGKQDAVVEELFRNYFTEEKYLNDREVLLAAATKAGLTDAQRIVDDEILGRQEVLTELNKYARGVTGVPFFIINNKYKLSGAQDPETFAEVFEEILSSS
eukprot:jgi/Mesvir1/26669/Mv20453-RA.1